MHLSVNIGNATLTFSDLDACCFEFNKSVSSIWLKVQWVLILSIKAIAICPLKSCFTTDQLSKMWFSNTLLEYVIRIDKS